MYSPVVSIGFTRRKLSEHGDYTNSEVRVSPTSPYLEIEDKLVTVFNLRNLEKPRNFLLILTSSEKMQKPLNT